MRCRDGPLIKESLDRAEAELDQPVPASASRATQHMICLAWRVNWASHRLACQHCRVDREGKTPISATPGN
jgi:hypothetical protein